MFAGTDGPPSLLKGGLILNQRILRAILLVALIATSSQVWPADWEVLLDQAQALSSVGQSDSSRTIFQTALQSAETHYSRSDTTVDVVFYDAGVPRRVHFPGYQSAAEIYSQFLSVAEKVYGTDGAEVSGILLKLAEVERIRGRYFEAEPLMERALGIAERKHGLQSLEAARVLDRLGVLYYYLGKYLESATFCDSGLVMREKLLGPDHIEVAWSCLNLAQAITRLGHYADAETFCRRAMKVLGGQFGDTSLAVTDCLEALGFVLYYRDENAAAESLYVAALDIRRQHLGPVHPDVARLMFRIANVDRYLGKYAEAESLLVETLAIRRAVYGNMHPEVGEVLFYTGILMAANVKDIDRALSCYAEAVEIFEKTLGETNSHAITARWRTATLFVGQGRNLEALAIFQRLVDLISQSLGSDHQDLRQILRSQTLALRRIGQFDKAEASARRALAITEKYSGPEHIDAAEALSALAGLYFDEGRYTEAEDMMTRGKEIAARASGNDSSLFAAGAEHELGRICYALGRYEEAEEYITEAIRLFKKFYGPMGTDLPIAHLNLGLVYENQGRYAEADSVYRLSVELGERSIGMQNPALAHALNNQANLYSRLGRYAEARSLQERAVSILEGALGPEHPEVAKFRCDQGRIYAYSSETDSALGSYQMFIDKSQKYLENVFPYSSEEQRLRWIGKYPLADPVVYSLALKSGTSRAKSVALEMLLKSKAMVIEAVMAERRAAYCHYDDEVLAELDNLSTVNEQIAGLAMAGGYYRDSVAILYKIRDSLEVALSTHCSEFSDALAARRFDVNDVVSSVPAGSVLWEFARYEPTNLDSPVLGDDKIDNPRYLAFTLSRSGGVGLHDLGDAGLIDSLILTARNMIYRSQGQIYSVAAVTSERRLREVTSQLYSLVFAPLADPGTTDIYVSPDGLLNLIPLEILPVSDSTYVIEKYRISYLSSGRDLLKHGGFVESGGQVLVMADPDFDGVGVFDVQKQPETVISDENYGPEFRGNTDCLKEKFSPIAYSRNEAASVVACFRNSKAAGVRQFYGDRAVEEVLKDLAFAPRVLHLATHGFFCEGSKSSEALRDNPLLRSGLVLAGANRTISNSRDDTDVSDDGILTALEVSGLNLVGTDLAVLSACESGVGDMVDGEGIFGLRRAFQHAGANTIVMSLWAVPDRETSQLMEGFYRRWLGGESKGDALRGSALELLGQSRSKRGCGHPLLWGGFILAGNPN